MARSACGTPPRMRRHQTCRDSRRIMSRLFATTAAIAALVAPPAYAADGSESGFYLGANAGVSRADTRKNDFDQAVVDALDLVGLPFSGTSSLDDRDTTYEFTVGYRVDSWLAVEAMYLDLGEVKYQADGEITSGVPASAGVDLERAGLGLSALVIVPLDKVDLFARAGVFYADTDYTVSVSADRGIRKRKPFGQHGGVLLGAWRHLSVCRSLVRPPRVSNF